MLSFFVFLEAIHSTLAGEASVTFSLAVSASPGSPIRPGWDVGVEVQGANFDVVNDKIFLVQQGYSCGDAAATSPRGRFLSGGVYQPLNNAADYYNLMCDGIGKGPTKLVCSGMQVLQAGTYTICICDDDATSPPVPASGLNTTTPTSTTTMAPVPCNVAERFWLGGTDTGVMTVGGARKLATQAWRAGKPQRLDLSGTSLSSADRIRIVDGAVDCADALQSKQMHPAVATGAPYEDPSGERQQGDSISERWRDIGIMTPGVYQVCWCSAGSGSCDSDEDFATNVATLDVGGPTAGVIQTFECVTGVACNLEIQGAGLNDNDRMYVISDHLDCGMAQHSGAVSQLGDHSVLKRTSGSSSASTFGGVVLARHGNFKICWCGSYDAVLCPTCCSTMQEYTVYAGNVTSGGPEQGQVTTPPVGVPITYTITGWGMSDIDRIRIVDSNVICGLTGAETHSAGLESSTVPNGPPSSVDGPGPYNRTRVTWTGIIVREMRTYRVCWCAHFFQGCTAASHFALEIGIVTPRGAANSTYIDAVPGRPFALTVAAAPGSTLSGDDRIRIVHSSVANGICGGWRTSEHSPAVSNVACWPTCVDSPVSGAPQMGANNESEVWDPVLITESGVYHICWCNAGTGGCDADEDFSFQAGAINARGVNIGLHFHCAAYFPCVLEIPLTDGLSGNDHVQMVPATVSARCGIDTAAPATSFSRGTRIKGYTGKNQDGADMVYFEFGSPQAPGVYLACYCQGTVCSAGGVSDLDFFQQAGQVTVMGLRGRDDYHKCYLRGTCNVHLRGTGLDAQDALMLVDPQDSCGQAGTPVSFSVDGPQFFTSSGDRLFVGSFTAETGDGLQSWNYAMGTPVRTGRYRLCYCSRTRANSGMCQERIDFDQPAGELFVRGSEFNSELRCDQGEMCAITSRGSSWDSLDRMLLLKAGENHSCGMINGGQYPHWSSPLTPEAVQPDAILPDLYVATWHIASVREPGTYHICYCSYIIGATDCVANGVVNYQGFNHQLGTVRVTGSILAVRRVGVTPNHWKPHLPAAPFAVSVEVDALTTFIKYTCVATSRAAPEEFVPVKSDLENCTQDTELLTERQKLFPRCWGQGTTVETVTEMGPNLVHVATFIPQVTLDATVNMHVWCYPRDGCSNGRCVMPSDNVGLTVPLTGGLVSTNNNAVATVATPFAYRLLLASDYSVGEQYARLKIITFGGACDTTQLHPSVMGITCLESGVGKCEPEPTSTLSSGSWGSGRELIWSGIRVNRADQFHVCYCDRHYAASCVGWVKVGSLQVSGPQGAGSLRFDANPAQAAQIKVQGIGLATEDRIRVVPQTVGCMQTSQASTEAPSTTAGGRRLQFNSAFEFYSGAATTANGSDASWEILIGPEGMYNVCWCGGVEGTCTQPNDFSVQLGTLQVAKRRDCEVTDWWVVNECDKPCGGGQVTMKRAITQEATGGGEACPLQSELAKVEQCNMKPCPLARLDRVTYDPPEIYAGVPFQLTIEGEWLDPDSDRIVVIDEIQTCGQPKTHHGGAACNRFSASPYRLVCGTGISSVLLQNPGKYKICVCDASASLIRNLDGTANLTTGNFEAAGIEGAGCATPDLYIHNPEQGAVFEVKERPLPAAASPEGETFSTGVILAIVSTGLFTAIALGLVGAYWVRKKLKGKPIKVVDESVMSKEKEAMQGGVDPNVLQFYESYYQSLGYPPGTAAQVLGQSQQQHQLALGMGGAMMQAQTVTPALQDSAWMQPRPMMQPLQLALPSWTPGMAPPTPQNRGRSPRGDSGGKSFGDLVSESNRRPSRQLPLFTDTSLPKMPTPTATPRGMATPRQDEHALALEDGKGEDAAVGDAEVDVTKSKSLEDVKERPSTADSVLSCLSESTGSGSRPGTGDSAKEAEASGQALSPVKEEQEEADEDKEKSTPRSFRTFFNDRVTKLLSTGGDSDRKPLFGSSFTGSFGPGAGAAPSFGDGVEPADSEDAAEAAEREAAEKAAQEAAEKEEAEKEAAQKAAREAEEKEAAEKAAREAAEREAAEKAAREAAEKEAAEVAAREAANKEAAEKAAREAAEKEAAAKAAKEAAEKEAAEKAARAAAEREAAEKAAKEAAEKEAAEKAAREAAERAAKEAAEKEAAEQAAREAAEKEAAEKAAREAAEKEAAEKAAREAAEREAAEKAAREAAEREAAELAAKEAAEREAAEKAAREAAEKEAAEKAAREAAAKAAEGNVTPGRAPPPPPPKAGEGSRAGSKDEKRPPPPPPKGKPAKPSQLAVDTEDSLPPSASASPGSRQDHSLQGLWQSQTPSGMAPLATDGPRDAVSRGGDSPSSAPNTERSMTPTGGRRPVIPGPGFIDTDFEDTLKSMGSVSDSPSSRKHHSLGGLAGSSANVVAADKKAGKVVTPTHSARSSRPPVRAVVPTRSPRTEVQAQERLLGHTLPPQ